MRLKILVSGLIILMLLVSINAQQAQAQAGNYIVVDFLANTLFTVPPPAGPPVAIWTGAPFVFPVGVAIDAAGNYIVVDAGPPAALFIVPPPAGPPVAIWTGLPFIAPVDVAIDASGNYIVADLAPPGALFIVPPPAGPPTTIFSGAPFAGPQGVAVVPGAPPPTPTPRPVGGTVLPANKVAILAPYLALVGLVGAVTVAFAVKRRRKP